MEIIQIKTLIDITCTNVKRANQGTQQQFEQHKNWITLSQCIEMRSIFTYIGLPASEVVDVKGIGFGSEYKGKHRVWTWDFYPDRSLAFAVDDNPIGLLVDVMHEVPVIKNLTETINITRAVFDCTNATTKNTIIKLISGS
jgi:hypothetical protein